MAKRPPRSPSAIRQIKAWARQRLKPIMWVSGVVAVIGEKSIKVLDVIAPHFAGRIILGRQWTDEETQRWWDRAQGQV